MVFLTLYFLTHKKNFIRPIFSKFKFSGPKDLLVQIFSKIQNPFDSPFLYPNFTEPKLYWDKKFLWIQNQYIVHSVLKLSTLDPTLVLTIV